MKKLLFIILAFIVFISANDKTSKCKNRCGGCRQNGITTLDSIKAESLSNDEKIGLTFMREEEKLARDVYGLFYDKYGRRIFNNINSSEERHTNAIKLLLERYEMQDPSANTDKGEFIDQDLQELYDTLIVKGETSVKEALKVGALIEEVDIQDIQKHLDEFVDNKDIDFVYNNLLNGSYNHLRAFVRNLSRFGIEYEPQVLSKEQFNKIVKN